MNIKKTIIAVLCAAAFMSLSGCDSQDYNVAMEMMVNHQWTEAREMFVALEDYKDSANLLTECDYNIALGVMENGDYEEAIAKFEDLNGYKDSADKITECSYQIASALYESGEYDKAAEAFEALGDYEDCADKVTECTYLNAKALFDAKSFEEALPLFESLEDYEDSVRCVTVCRLATESKRFVRELVKDMEDIMEDNDFNYELLDVSEFSSNGDICYFVTGNECTGKVLVAFLSFDSDGEIILDGPVNSIIIYTRDITEENFEAAFSEIMVASAAALAAIDSSSDTEETMLKVIDEFDETATIELSEIDVIPGSTNSEFTQNGFDCFVEITDVIAEDSTCLYGFAFGINVPELLED